MARIAIVVDSTADIPTDSIKELDITSVPAYVIADGKSYRDGLDLSREKFAEILQKITNSPQHLPLPTTSTPNQFDFERVYIELAKKTDSIISIHPPAELSGIYNSARLGAESAKEKIKPRELEIRVIDSSSVSFGSGIVAIEAACLSRAGKDMDEIEKRIEEIRSKITICALVDDLRFIKEGGRSDKVDGWKISLGSWLKIKVILRFNNGELALSSIHRTKRNGIERLVQKFDEFYRKNGIAKAAIIHALGEAEAKEFAERLKENCPDLEIPIIQTGPVLTAQTGPNVVAFAVLTK